MRAPKIPTGIKASFVIFLAGFISAGISFLTTPIFTRLMSIEEYGLVAQYNSWLNIITVFSTLSLSAGVFQVAMNEFKNDRDGFTFSAMILSNLATVLVYLIIFLGINHFSELFELPISLIILMFLYNLFYPAQMMWIARERYELNYLRVAVVSILAAVISQVASLLLVLYIKDINLGILKAWGSGFTMVLFSLALYISIGYKARFHVSKKYMIYALKFNVPLLIHYLAQYVLRSTDKIMISHYCGTGPTGIYNLAATIANISNLAWVAMNASLTPYIYENLNRKNNKRINVAVVGVTILFGFCCIIVSMIGPEVVLILGSKKYAEGIQLIPPIAASCLLQAVYSNYSSITFYYHKRISTSVMTIIAALLNVILNWLLIPKYGFIAAAYTTEIAYFSYTVLHFLNYRNIVKENRIYNDKIIWTVVMCITIACIATGFLYDYLYVRMVIVIGMVFAIVLNRNKVINIMKGNY